MQSELANILINRNILLVGMEIEATYESITLDGTSKVAAFGGFMIQKIIRNEETTEFQTVSIHDGHKRIIHVEDVSSIDGMDPIRFAAVYDIQSDGSNARVGKRRGRKPNHYTE